MECDVISNFFVQSKNISKTDSAQLPLWDADDLVP